MGFGARRAGPTEVPRNMPIRFRCQYCSQLLGIARRKAGSQVACPTCRRSLTVPQEEAAAVPGPSEPPPVPPPPPAPAPALFEREDFEQLLNGPGAPSLMGPAPVPPPAPAAWSAPPPYAPSPGVLAPQEAGIVLSPARATVLTVVLILALAVAFGAGLLVGKFYLAGP